MKDKNPSFFCFHFLKFLFGGQLLYNVVLVSALQQHESATSVYTSPTSGASLPTPHLLPFLAVVFWFALFVESKVVLKIL